jgi:hypothetical protein
VSIWDLIAEEASRESPLWAAALRPEAERELEAVFSPLGDEGRALGVETIYEGYLLHYGRPRLFEPRTPEDALLLGDYLYAHGLVRVAELHDVQAVADLAALISICAQLRAEGVDGDDAAWAATAALAGADGLAPAREALRDRRDAAPLLELARGRAGDEAVERSRAAHRRRVG